MPRQVDAGGLQVACSVTGAGPALLLLHGAEGDHRMFDALVPLLAAAFTVIAYDQRDCGGTEGPPQTATLEDLAADAAALLRALGIARAHVYGTSFGGRVAQALAHRHHGLVDRLVLGNTWDLPDGLESLNPAVRDIQALRAGLPDTAQTLAEYFFPPAFLQAQPQHRALFRNAQPQSERSRRRQQAVADHPPLPARLLAVPTLVLAGALDRVVPPAISLALAREIPQARCVVLADVGHAAAIQAPELVARHVTDFCMAVPHRTTEVS